MPNKWRYYEGTASANSILTDIAKVLCTGVKDEPIRDSEGNIVKPSKTIPENNWDIVFPAAEFNKLPNIHNREDLTVDEYLDKINHQLTKVTDTIVLKTVTSPVTVDGEATDDLGLENDLAKEKITMYLELYKPKYLADPEQFHPETERIGPLPYLVTRAIYEEYASNIGKASFNILNIPSGYGTVMNGLKLIKNLSKPDSTQTNSVNSNYIHYCNNIESNFKVLSDLLLPSFNKSPLYYVSHSSPNNHTTTRTPYFPRGGTVGSADHWDSTTATREFTPSQITEPLAKALFEMFGAIFPEDYTSSIDKIKLSAVGTASKLPNSSSNYISIFSTSTGGVPITTTELISTTFTIEAIRYTLTVHTPVDEYKIENDFTIQLTNFDKIHGESVKVKLGENSLAQAVYNKVSGEIVFSAVPSSGWLDAIKPENNITVEYTYEREERVIAERKLLYNNHYIYARMFDNIEKDPLKPNYMRGPIGNIIDPSTGDYIQINSHTSEWGKLSWYQDFQEVLIDELDGTVTTNNISKGTAFLPLETPGLNGDTRLRFWVNTSNNRFSMVLMGNPSLDFSANRHLTSMFYVGRIESFKSSINDTAGNFALMTSSSTVPCATRTVINRVSNPDSGLCGTGNGILRTLPLPTLSRDRFYDRNAPFTIIRKVGEDEATVSSSDYSIVIDISNQSGVINFRDGFAPAQGVQIYARYTYYQEKTQQIKGIVRDTFGNILEVKYPENWGKNTATGVTDICMLHTRSKAYFQKHHMMFTTTEEYMTKEMYGKSAYTGEYYADRIKVTHGNDGPRGMLEDVLVIDQSSLVALDELIVNRDFEKDIEKPQETYVFFPINAPFSPFSGSPNALYGLAIKKEHIEPAPKSDQEAVERVLESLYIGKLSNVMVDMFLPTSGENDVIISWIASDETLITLSDPN